MPNTGQRYAPAVYAELVAKSKPNSGILLRTWDQFEDTKLLGFLEKSFNNIYSKCLPLKNKQLEKVGRQLGEPRADGPGSHSIQSG